MRSTLPTSLVLLYPILLGLQGALAAVGPTTKAGLAWPNGDTVSMGQFAASGKVSWYYTWIADPIRFDSDLEFVPLLWGDADSIKNFDKSMDKVLKDRPQTTAVMGMNEPDHEGQAALTPQQGAEVWIEHMEPLKARGLRLGSPGCTSAASGKQWLQDWLQQCNGGCNFDFLVLHHYGWNATHFINYVTDMYQTFQKPVWVTEWACHDFSTTNQRTCTAEQVSSYLNTTQSWLDSNPWVERYAWFGAMKDTRNVNPLNGLLDQNGALNPLGLQYINWTGPGVPDSSLPRGANANRPPNAAASLQGSFLTSAISLSLLSLSLAGFASYI
ncbi:hypothetical protein H1R20_g10461, partial [Candolleomyces eurysporus]